MNYDTEDIIETLKIKLSKKRFTHSMNVAEAAVKLAKAHGADKEKAYVAGLVHDICKEMPHDEQLIMAKNCGRDFTDTEALVPPLYHSAAGAYYAENVLGIHDENDMHHDEDDQTVIDCRQKRSEYGIFRLIAQIGFRITADGIDENHSDQIGYASKDSTIQMVVGKYNGRQTDQ